MKRFVLILFLTTHIMMVPVGAVLAVDVEEAETNVEPTQRVVETKKEASVNMRNQEVEKARAKKIEEQKTALEKKREELSGKREEKKATGEAKMEELKIKRQEKLSEVANRRFENIVKRFNAAVARVENIIERFNSRLDQLAENGYDVTQAQAYVDEASEHVAAAKAIIDTSEVQFDAVLASDNPASSFASIHDIFSQAKEELLLAHESLRSALSEIKSLLQSRITGIPARTPEATTGALPTTP